VITSDQAFDLLVEGCPSYFGATDLDRYVAAFEDEATPDLFIRMSAFAHFVVDLVARNEQGELRAVFSTLERLLEDGDPETIELVELGFIETVQNIVSHEDVIVGADRVTPLLGPAATKVWNDHDELWRDAGRWRHDGLRVEQADYDSIIDPNLRRYFQAHKRRMEDGALISASDIVFYQTELQNLSAVTPAGRPRVPWPAVIIGLVLALAAAIALYR
jgi:hypothetical protein